jgi:hypothetical protein
MIMQITPTGPYRLLNVRGNDGTRYVVHPGDDVSGLPQAVQDAVAEQHIPSVVAAYQANLPPPPTLADLKAAKKDAINAERDRRETEGFEFNGVMYDSDERSAQRIAVAVGAALAAPETFSVTWTAQDNSEHVLDAAGVLGLNGALAAYGDSVHQTAKTLKAAVDDAEDAEGVAAVVWPPS